MPPHDNLWAILLANLTYHDEKEAAEYRKDIYNELRGSEQKGERKWEDTWTGCRSQIRDDWLGDNLRTLSKAFAPASSTGRSNESWLPWKQKHEDEDFFKIYRDGVEWWAFVNEKYDQRSLENLHKIQIELSNSLAGVFLSSLKYQGPLECS